MPKEPKDITLTRGEVYTLTQILEMFGISEDDYNDAIENNNGVIPIKDSNTEIQFIDTTDNN